MGFSVVKAVLATLAIPFFSAAAVKYGDEYFGGIEGGRFWAFHSFGISVIDPESCSIEDSFKTDLQGNPLPSRWYDGVYMEKEADLKFRQQSGEHQKGYVIINSAVGKSDGHIGEGGSMGEVYVFSATPNENGQPLIAQVLVGPRPVHSYGVYPRDEFWSHSDGDGQFYIIHLSDLDEHTGKPVQAKVTEPNHGKLLWDEDSHLERHGYATSTGERHLFVIDMETHELLKTVDFNSFLEAPFSSCFGTHAIAYSGKNRHLYLECTGPGGILEFDVSNPADPQFVAQHTGVTGSLYETPDGQYVVASDKGGDVITVFDPQGTGVKSSKPHTIDAPGKPSTVTFFPNGDDAGEYIACAPLTGNPNRNHMYANGTVACNLYTGCDNPKTQEDVDAGLCLYDVDANGNDDKLAEVTASLKLNIQQGVAPYFGACNRCLDDNNYDLTTGTCVCTPDCGTCAAVDPDLSRLGVRCFDMKKVLEGSATTATLIAGAGAVKQGAYGSAECGFGRTYRTHKRGGKYDASVAHYPTNSIQIVNMETQEFKCSVDLPGEPSRVVYVPPQTGSIAESIDDVAADDTEDDGLSGGAIAGIVVGSIAAVALVAFVAKSSGGSNSANPVEATKVEDGQEAASAVDQGIA